MSGVGDSMAAFNSGVSDSHALGEQGMSNISAANTDSIKQIEEQGQLSAARSFAEAHAKTVKAGADSVKGLV